MFLFFVFCFFLGGAGQPHFTALNETHPANSAPHKVPWPGFPYEASGSSRSSWACTPPQPGRGTQPEGRGRRRADGGWRMARIRSGARGSPIQLAVQSTNGTYVQRDQVMGMLMRYATQRHCVCGIKFRVLVDTICQGCSPIAGSFGVFAQVGGSERLHQTTHNYSTFPKGNPKGMGDLLLFPHPLSTTQRWFKGSQKGGHFGVPDTWPDGFVGPTACFDCGEQLRVDKMGHAFCRSLFLFFSLGPFWGCLKEKLQANWAPCWV